MSGHYGRRRDTILDDVAGTNDLGRPFEPKAACRHFVDLAVKRK